MLGKQVASGPNGSEATFAALVRPLVRSANYPKSNVEPIWNGHVYSRALKTP
jgi:hypothetical protein